MGAIDRRLGVDGCDLFGRISAHPRRTLCNGIGQVYYGPVVLITDALSYSATDIFAAGFQDNEVGVVLGTGGNTGAGGANFWSLDDLLRAQKKDPKSPFKTTAEGRRDDRGHAPQHSGRSARRLAAWRNSASCPTCCIS